ncbi:MAG: AAA family ATPase [Bacilli bacterium]|nr:AAA family ATPase [Bacilli bacterium]MDD4718864.1 AAA family ATPase [Bacilli bacterium]
MEGKLNQKELKEKFKKLTKEEQEKFIKKERSNSVDYDNIVAKETDFIMNPYLPLGKIVIFMGDPGSSKSSYALKIASAITKGDYAPFTGEKLEQRNVVIQNVEDGLEDTIKPRLEAFGANFKFVKTIDEDGKDINGKTKKLFLNEYSRIETILKRYNPLLFIIDPIQSYLQQTDLKDASKIRNVLGPIAQLANKYNCTFIFIMHLNKGDSKSLYRGLGSIDFIGIARSVLLIGKSPSNNEEIVVEHIKYNLSQQGKSFAYKVIGDSKGIKDIEYLGERDYFSFDDFQNNSPNNNARDLAKLFLNAELANGLVGASELVEKAKLYGIAKSTLDRAKKELKVESKQEDCKWYWYKPLS